MKRLANKFKPVFAIAAAAAFFMPAGTVFADPTYTISGTLYDGSNNPIHDAMLYFATDESQDYTVDTDANGHYSIELPPDVYAGGLFGIPYDGGDFPQNTLVRRNSSAPIDITAGNATQDFHLDTIEVTVTVKDYLGNPVSGYQAGAISTSPTTFTDGSSATNTQTSRSWGVTDSNGQATIKVLKGATYQPCAISTGGYYICGSEVNTSSNTPSLEVQFPQLSTLSGTLKGVGGQAVTGCADVQLTNDGVPGDMHFDIDVNGHYSADVPPDVHGVGDISYYDCHMNAASIAPSYAILKSAGRTVIDGHQVDLTNGSLTKDLVFDTATVTVTVKDANGTPLSNVAADLTSNGNGSTTLVDGSSAPYSTGGGSDVGNSTLTGSNGTAEVVVLKGMEYQVCTYTTERICNATTITPTGDMSVELQTP